MDEQNEPIEVLPWERQEEEPLKHYSWFHAFLMLGPGRSLLGAYNGFHAKSLEKSGKVWKNSLDASKSWKEAAHKWKWKGRAALWDADQRRLEREEEAERRRKLRNRNFDLAEKSADKTEEMLRFPVASARVENGKTIIEPGKWNFNTVARFLLTIDKLTKEEKDDKILKHIDLSQLNDEQLNRLAAGEDILSILISGLNKPQSPDEGEGGT